MKKETRNNNKQTISLDTLGFNNKPQGSEIALISKRIATNSINISPELLAKEVVLPDAKTWCPAIFNGERSNSSWISQQYFALDFDGVIDFQKVIKRCKEYNIIPVFAYSTFSSVNNSKFRIVFLLDHTINTPEIQTLIVHLLLKIFPESDKACKDKSRIFFGGKEIIYENYESYITIDELIINTYNFLKDKDSRNHVTHLKQLAKKTGLILIKNFPLILEADSEEEITELWKSQQSKIKESPLILYNYYSGKGDSLKYYFLPLINLTNSSYKGESYKSQNKQIGNINFNELSNRCKLFNEFITGKRWLYHDELFKILTNLHWVEGGKKQFFNGLRSRPEYCNEKYKDKLSHFEKDYERIHRLGYFPARCENYCPYATNCKHPLNILGFFDKTKNRIKEIEKHHFSDAKTEYHRMDLLFKDILSYDDTDIYIINAPTGIGKTELYTSISNILIAVPTHKLKDEIENRIKYPYKISTPEVPSFGEDIDNQLARMYRTGNYKKAYAKLEELAYSGFEQAEEYIYKLKVSQEYEGTVITTHHRAIFDTNINSAKNTIIFDEDPIDILIREDTIDYNDLVILGDLLKKNFPEKKALIDKSIENYLSQEEERIIKNDSNILTTLIDSVDDIEQRLFDAGIKSNVIEFVNSAFFIIRRKLKRKKYFKYCIKNDLPKNSKIIILSATVNNFFYKNLFGDRVNFYQIDNIELSGILLQDTSRSYSRYQLNKNPEHTSEIKEIIGKVPVITFKKNRNTFKNTIATFGATSGLDNHGGKDLCVVGTPHYHIDTYLFHAHLLNIHYNDDEIEFKLRRVQYNGFEFDFFTCSINENLVKLQLSLIEKEIVQAVGRARLSREKCTVKLFSRLPIVGAQFVNLHDK